MSTPLDTDAYEEWMLGQGLSAKTIRLRKLFAVRVLGDWGTWDQPPSFVSGWLAQYDQWTRRTYQNHLASLYKFLVEVGALESSPVARIRMPPNPAPRPKPLSDVELETVLSSARGNLRAWLLLASKAGLRASEIAKLRGEDVDEFGLTVLGKGSKVERLPLHPEIVRLAQDYPARGWWFPSGQNVPAGHVAGNSVTILVGRHFRAHGIDGSIHRCRHTYGTRLVRAGTQLHVVQSLMRHSSLATTQAYLGVDEEERTAAIARI